MPNLTAYIPMDRRLALARGETLPDRAYGTTLFADISGFTPLTAALAKELGRQRGAEEVLHQIDAIYEVLIAALHAYQGSAINFAGDAITCFFNEDDGRRAVACAHAMQVAMEPFNEVVTPAGTVISLGIKVAVAVGPVRRFVVGDPKIQRMDVLAGATLDEMAAAEKVAERGEVVATHRVVDQLGDLLQIGAWRQDAETDAQFALVTGLNRTVAPNPWTVQGPTGFPEAEINSWLLPAVASRLQAGDSFLAELRLAAALFLNFSGIDYDEDEQAGEKLDTFICWVQSVVQRYDGALLQLSMGDKGSYLYVAFGAPSAHDDDAARAVAAGLDLRMANEQFSFIKTVQVGVSQGRVWSGAYGSTTRHTYGVMGNDVNMAARLMAKAVNGQVLVNQQVAEAARKRFLYRELGEITVKGRTEPLAVSEVLDKQDLSDPTAVSFYTQPLVGREAVLEQMGGILARAARGYGQVLRLEGGAGIGKSHLTAVFSQNAQVQGFEWLAGACQSLTQGTPYTPWRQILKTLFGITAVGQQHMAVQVDRQRAEINTVRDYIRNVNPAWLDRLPLLGGLLGLPITDNAITAAMDPSLRQEALFSLVADILEAHARQHPLLIAVKDVHWMDEASQELTQAVARALSRSSVLLLVVQRPPLDSNQLYLPGLDRLDYYQEIVLDELTPEGISALAENRVGGLLSGLARDIIQQKAQGNPFFAEELVDTLLESDGLTRNAAGEWVLALHLAEVLEQNGLLETHRETGERRLVAEADLTAVDLGIPDSVHGLVLSRIDRLPEAQKLTLKVASVIGRGFSLELLAAVHPSAYSADRLDMDIDRIMKRDFVRREDAGRSDKAGAVQYLFKHNITQEVAYGTLLFAQRRQLHRAVAEWHERTYGGLEAGPGDGAALSQLSLDDALAPYFPVLAHHWRYAEDETRERGYAALAGRQAAAQYANEDAMRYLTRALDLTPQDDPLLRYDLLFAREAVLDWLGRREMQGQDLAVLDALAGQLDDVPRRIRAVLRAANYYRTIGKFGQALGYAEQGIDQASRKDDAELQAEAHYIAAQILRQQGEYKQAEKHLALAGQFAASHGNQKIEADSLVQMGNVYFQTGDFQTAQRFFRESLPIFQTLSDRRGETGALMMLGVIHTGSGEYLTGQSYYQRALDNTQSIGYQFGETLILGNLGVNYANVGDYKNARITLEQAIRVSEEIGDLEGLGIGLSNLASIDAYLTHFDAAVDNCHRALRVQNAIDDRRNKGFTLTYLGYALTHQGEEIEAIRAYKDALEIRRELGEQSLMVDNYAGLAWACWLAGERQQSLEYVDQALTWLDENGVEGVENPLLAYLNCCRVLQHQDQDAAARERAGQVLKTAYNLLQQQVEEIKDQALQEMFLSNVPAHREIQMIWKTAQAGAGTADAHSG